jgi:hypothetical protein
LATSRGYGGEGVQYLKDAKLLPLSKVKVFTSPERSLFDERSFGEQVEVQMQIYNRS